MAKASTGHWAGNAGFGPDCDPAAPTGSRSLSKGEWLIPKDSDPREHSLHRDMGGQAEPPQPFLGFRHWLKA